MATCCHILHAVEIFSPSALQEIPRLLWNPRVHCPLHKNRPLDPILNQVCPHLISTRSVLILLTHVVVTQLHLKSRISNSSGSKILHFNEECLVEGRHLDLKEHCISISFQRSQYSCCDHFIITDYCSRWDACLEEGDIWSQAPEITDLKDRKHKINLFTFLGLFKLWLGHLSQERDWLIAGRPGFHS